jgi:RHS repeat-associated protein
VVGAPCGNVYDFAAREYGIQGRWPSPDPSGVAAVDLLNPQSWNRYAYANNGPLNSVDPLGLNVYACFARPTRLDTRGTCDYGNMGGGGGDDGGDGGGCTIDGAADVSCSMGIGAVQCPNNVCSGVGTAANGNQYIVQFNAFAGGGFRDILIRQI